MSNLIGVDESNMTVYDKSMVKQESENTSYPKAVVFKDGGHYSFLTHSKIVNEKIAKLIEDSIVNCGKYDSDKKTSNDTKLEVSDEDVLKRKPTFVGSSQIA